MADDADILLDNIINGNKNEIPSTEKKSNLQIHSFGDILGDILKTIKYKHIIYLFLIFIFICSDIVIDHILIKIPGAVEQRSSTGYGTVIQGVLLVFGFLIIDALIGHDLI